MNKFLKLFLNKRIVALLLTIILCATNIIPIVSSIAVSTQVLEWSTLDGTNLCNFSDTKTIILTVRITSPTEEGESIKIELPSNLILVGHTDTGALPYTESIVQSGNTLVLNLKTNITGTFTETISVRFDEKVSWHNETAAITATQYNGSTAIGTPSSIILTEYNDSLPYISYTASNAITPGGYVTYRINIYTMIKTQDKTSYESYNNKGISCIGTLIFPIPEEAEEVTIITGNATYNAVNRIVVINKSNGSDLEVQIKVKYSSMITVGQNITTEDAPSFTGTTQGGKYAIPEDIPIYKAIAKINQKVTDISGKTLNLSASHNATGTILIGEGSDFLYSIGFKNTSPLDYEDLEISTIIPDGMYATSVHIPAGNTVSTNWSGNLTIIYSTNMRNNLQTAVISTSSSQILNATALGLGENEYITEFKFVFENFKANDSIAEGIWLNRTIYILGYVGTKYRDNTLIQNGDIITLNAQATHDKAVIKTYTTNTKYTTEEISVAGGTVDLVNSSNVVTTNNNFYPGDSGKLRIKLMGSVYNDFRSDANINYLKDPILWIILPNEFKIDTTNISISNSSGTVMAIKSAIATDVDVGVGNRLYCVKLIGTIDMSKEQASTIYLPFQVDQYAMPGICTIGNNYYVSSATQTVRRASYSSVTVSDTYDFNQDGLTIDTLAQMTDSNKVKILNILFSGFSTYHKLTSALTGVALSSYEAENNSTVAHFSEGGLGIYNVVIKNADSDAIDQYVAYERLPNDSNVSTPDLMLAGPIVEAAGFEITYTTAVNPERNELTGGIDTTYVSSASISDWSLVTGYKIKATAPIPSSSVTTIAVNVRASNIAEVTGAPEANYYKQVRVGDGVYFARREGDAEGTEYQMSSLAFDIQNTLTPPTINLSQNPVEETWTNQDVTIIADFVAAGENVILAAKWLEGIKTVADFASAGNALIGIVPSNQTATGTFEVEANGTYTVYTRDNAGLTTVQTITIGNMDKIEPTITVNLTEATICKNTSITITVADIGGSGLASTNSYQYQLGTSDTEEPEGTWENYVSRNRIYNRK